MELTNTIFAVGFILRFLTPTIFPTIPIKLSSSVELSTPLNSYKSLQEAFFYIEHAVNPYDGGANHHPPLLVAFFQLFKDLLPEEWFQVTVNFLYATVDIIIAKRLVALNNWYHNYNCTRRKQSIYKMKDALIVSFYLFNPLIILSNLSHCTLAFTLLFVTESIYQLTNNKNLSRSMLSLSIATYLSLNPVLLLIPILTLAHSILKVDELARIYFIGPALFISSCALLVFLSIVLTSSISFIDQCYGIVIRFDKIQPNIGLWWYFFTEMFDFFTPFYLGIFNIFSCLFIFPISIRFFEYHSTVGDSFLAVFLCYIWMSFLKSYPTIADLGYGISLIPIFAGTILPYCKLIYITGLTFLICLVLSPIFYYSWIVLGNGNSNFFYSINLIWGAVHILISIDFMWGKLISDYCDTHNVAEKDRFTIRLTQL